MKDQRQVSEKLIAQIWKGLAGERLCTSDGREVDVVYPGRKNTDHGPDFQDAIIATGGGELITGDIEIHIRASDWRAHGHHRDPRYNGVILQVALWDDEQAPAMLEDGRAMPTLALSQWLTGSVAEIRHWASRRQVPAEPCRQAAECLGDAVMGRLLDEAGEQRFRLKAALFGQGISEGEAEQALYQGIMRALGYAKNKERFQQLASRLPMPVIQGLVRGQPWQRGCLILRALLLGTAGLLPSQRGMMLDGEEVAELERQWRCFDAVAVMNHSQWHLFRVRPENHPTRRLIAASYLLSSFLPLGLLRSVLELVNGGQRKLEAGFMLSARGYWGEHFDFGCRTRNPNLIGRGRARDVIVNIVLPFTFAWAQLNSQPELGEHALELYRGYPKLAENEITREVAGLLWGGNSPKPVNSAQRQQGLLHLFHSFCRQRKCAHCPIAICLSQPEVWPDIEVQGVGLARDEVKIATGGDHGGIVGAQGGAGAEDGGGGAHRFA
jgi:hypothetical protein